MLKQYSEYFMTGMGEIVRQNHNPENPDIVSGQDGVGENF